MTQIKLLGELGDKFGSEWASNSKSIRDILKLIDCQVEGFKEYLQDCHEKNIGFTIQNGEDFIDYDDLMLCRPEDTVIISPVPAGSGKGLGKILAAIAMIVVMIYNPTYFVTAAEGATIAEGATLFTALEAGATMNALGYFAMSIGANLALMGLVEMTAPDAGDNTSDPSFLFNGADNSLEQGKPVPLLYGKMKIGGVPISQQFTPSRIKNTNGYLHLSGDSDYFGTRYVGANGTIGVGSATGGSAPGETETGTSNQEN